MDQKQRELLQLFGYKELPGYEAIDHELVVLVQYWMKASLTRDFMCFQMGLADGEDSCFVGIANARLVPWIRDF